MVVDVDPNLLEVLDDIAKDPRARLFRETPQSLLAAMRGESLFTRPSRTGLTHAEQHLLRVHREEYAYWLRQAALCALQRPEVRDPRLVYPEPAQENPPKAIARALGIASVKCAKAAAKNQEYRQAMKLASRSLRLSDHSHAWCYLAVASFLAGSARSLVQIVLASLRAERSYTSTWYELLGFMYSCSRKPRRAALAYLAASEHDTNTGRGAFEALSFSILEGMEAWAMVALERANNFVLDDQTLGSLIYNKKTWRAGVGPATSPQLRLTGRVARRATGQVERVVHALVA